MLNPVAFSIGPVPVHWYGIIIGVGVWKECVQTACPLPDPIGLQLY